MTTEREMLEYAAKACGYEVEAYCDDGSIVVHDDSRPYGFDWNPLTNSADCAAMCAKLMLDSDWYADSIRVVQSADLDWDQHEETAYFKDHNNDREAAWRFAACKVAEAIGREMK